MSVQPRRYLALPSGDPAGIGIEILLKALQHFVIDAHIGIIVIADEKILAKTAEDLGIPYHLDRVVSTLDELKKACAEDQERILLAQDVVPLKSFEYGVISAECGQAAYQAVHGAVAVINAGLAEAVVTPPLHKEALRAAHINEIGHTEILQTLTGTTDAVTMFETLGLKIFFHSRHLSLREACDAVTHTSLLKTIITCDMISRENSSFDMSLPLAVAALNPHGGDGGLFGDEEIVHINPAIEDARAKGINVVGPIGADSVFHQGRIGMWRAVISLYHDQGHIAAKTLDFNQTISITWGLPFLRTSVDHGTAFDIAGKGVADASGMLRALQVAREYVSPMERSHEESIT